VNGLRETKLTNVNRYHVRRFTYAAGRRSLAVSLSGRSTWRLDDGREVSGDSVYALLVALLEPATTGWSAGAATGSTDAALTYTVEGGVEGSVSFRGSRATWSGAPGVIFTLGAPPPPVPAL
jgi:hypothetical protein